LLAAAISLAAQTPVPPALDHWVTDTAGFMPPDAAAQLDSRLQGYEQKTHHQLIVWIGKSLGGEAIEDWSAKAVKTWGVGRKGENDGIALIVFADDHRLRFEVGYGLESKVTDLIASRIIRNIITPQLRSGDNAGAITSGMEALVEAIGEGPLPGQAYRAVDREDYGDRPVPLIQKLFFLIIGIAILGFLVTHPSLVLMLLAGNILGGGRRRGG